MNLAEVLAAALAAFLAAAPVAAYVLDALGLPLSPIVVLILSVAAAGAAIWHLRRTAVRGGADFAWWAAVVVSVFAGLLSLAWPSLLLPGRGPDLTHHLLLVDYIERAGHLVRDRSLDGAMGEMAHYTPGAHVLAVLVGAWTGTDGFRAFYPLLAAATALSAGFVYLIARRLLLPNSFAIAAALCLLLPRAYFVGAFTHDSFLAQALAAFFCVASWWALIAWEQRTYAMAAALFGLFLTAVFLTWPMWIGPPLLVFLVVLLRRHTTVGWRVQHLLIVTIPLGMIAALHVTGRLGWLLIARTSGAVVRPSLAVLGSMFPALSLVGIVQAIRAPRSYITLGFLLAIVLQAITLWIAAENAGAETPYMALKMIYLAIYPLAVLVAFGLHASIPRVSPAAPALGWAVVVMLVINAGLPALTAATTAPVVSADLYAAGRWMRANVGASCADYLVADADTAYWLHLAVLGNPRSSARTAEVDRYDPNAEVGRWVAGQGRGYAVADLGRLPDEVRGRVAVLAQFGSAAVIRRPGAGACEAS